MTQWRESQRLSTSSSSSCLVKPRPTEVKVAIVPAPQDKVETKREYKGRIRVHIACSNQVGESMSSCVRVVQTWPGLVLLAIFVTGAIVLIATSAQRAHQASKDRAWVANELLFRNRSGTLLPSDILDSVIATPDDDGQVGNPKTYPASRTTHLEISNHR
ncbi:hypothetical protein DYB34_002368 [Aphanomyces astaci]|uniref:Uncharacterized protein n=1 Tax=Aphanomyces astaci TaxID=112090 RepID=A0A418C4B1_APHAT|nr:hypothetical protein DYB34_002368 [Aphanomyces astaci]